MATVAVVVEGKQERRLPRSTEAGAQSRLFELLASIGVTYEQAARYVGKSKQAGSAWALGERGLARADYAKLLALLPWCVINAQMQAAGRMDRAAIDDLVEIERAADEVVNAALADAELAPQVQRHWQEIHSALRSPEGRGMLDALTRRYAQTRPKGRA